MRPDMAVKNVDEAYNGRGVALHGRQDISALLLALVSITYYCHLCMCLRSWLRATRWEDYNAE